MRFRMVSWSCSWFVVLLYRRLLLKLLHIVRRTALKYGASDVYEMHIVCDVFVMKGSPDVDVLCATDV